MSSIFSHIRNRSLAHVVRFNATPQHFGESVAEHSFYVAYIVQLLCDLLEKEGVKVDKRKALSMALIHDVEEMYSGDILSPFKHYSEEVHDAIRKVNEQVIQDSFSDLPAHLQTHYSELWREESRQESVEAQIVKHADRLSLVAKCAEEVEAGNRYFKEIYDRELKKLQDDDKEWWGKIKQNVLP